MWRISARPVPGHGVAVVLFGTLLVASYLITYLITYSENRRKKYEILPADRTVAQKPCTKGGRRDTPVRLLCRVSDQQFCLRAQSHIFASSFRVTLSVQFFFWIFLHFSGKKRRRPTRRSRQLAEASYFTFFFLQKNAQNNL